MARPESGNDYHKLFSQGYLAHSNEKEILSPIIRDLLKDRKMTSFLDVGPGDGTISKIFAEHSQEIVFVEPQKRFCEQLKQTIPSAKIINSKIQDAPFKEKSFDAVLGSHVLYYFPLDQWSPLVNRLYSWVKPGGRLYLILNCADSDWYRMSIELARLLKVVPGFSFWDPDNFFQSVVGGASRLIHFDSVFDFQGTSKQLEGFILELMLLLPRELITKEQCNTLQAFVQKQNFPAGQLRLNFKHVIGIWEKPK